MNISDSERHGNIHWFVLLSLCELLIEIFFNYLFTRIIQVILIQFDSDGSATSNDDDISATTTTTSMIGKLQKLIN